MKISFSNFYYNSDDNNIYDIDTNELIMHYHSLINHTFKKKIERVKYYYNYMYEFFDWGNKNKNYVQLKEIKQWFMDIGPLNESNYKTYALHVLLQQHECKKIVYKNRTWYELPSIKHAK